MSSPVPETIEFFSCRICTFRALTERGWTAHKIGTGHVVFQTFHQRSIDHSPIAFCPRCRHFCSVRRQITSNKDFVLVCNDCSKHGYPYQGTRGMWPMRDCFFSYAQVDELTRPHA